MTASASRAQRDVSGVLADIDGAELINSCLDQPNHRLLSIMAAQSYRHANGFDKISFSRLPGSDVRLRLHIWPGTAGAQSDPDAHNHRWAFVSRVLCGALANYNYAVAHKQTGEFMRYVQTPYTPEVGSTFAFVGCATLTQLDAIRVAEGGTYSLSAQEIHRVVVPENGYTATLALELAPTRDTADLYTASSFKQTGVVVDSPRFTSDEVRDRLTLLRDRLHQGAGT
ncbi:hypothetical protein [Catenulispora sp. GP43]|uniref:hypothetical protein n=1 Tax=Catenulispora sp. GP43 TaxID=3156263 RepID=UPI003512B2C3